MFSLSSGNKTHLIVGVLFLVTSASGQWANPWMEGAPSSSPAYGHSNVTNSSLFVEEGIAANSILAVLRYSATGGYSQPELSACTNTIRLSSITDTTANVVSQRIYDYESTSFPVTESCPVIIYNNGIPSIKTINFKMVDINDNYPIFTNLPSSLQFEEHKLGFLHQFTASDIDRNDAVTFSLTVTVGDGSHFFMESTTGKLNVIKELDYETRQLYLLTIEATDKVGHTMPTEVALSVLCPGHL